jgi:membrane-bound lytic murein transglycosylase B
MQRFLPILTTVLLVLPASTGAARSKAERFDMKRAEIAAFVDEVAARNDSLDRKTVRRVLSRAEPQPKIIELMTRPAERVSPWWEYRSRFMTDQRIDEGAQFWLKHREVLDRVAAEKGVPAQYIVAIIGVETFYGRNVGKHRVLDALMTLAFDYPPRSGFFRSELEHFLLLAREEKIDPLKAKGSYAGAMGAPQFMPSSYRRFAVDGGSDQKRDLWNAWDDVFASVANYFREHGWEPGSPVLLDTRIEPDATFQIDTRNLDLNTTLDELNANGVTVNVAWPATTPAVLVSAEQKEGPAYRVGLRNFYVITRYNRSARYAMAVHDLAEAINERVSSLTAGTGS